MATIGSYYVRVLPDMSGFNAPLVRTLGSTMGRAGDNAGSMFSRSLLGFVSRVAIGTTIGRLVTNGFNTVVNGFSTGIERLDIIENYPNIMANLGIANEDAQRSVERLQEALLGLPTSLQGGVQATTRLTSALGDIDRSTDAFIAFNNALVAGMAPASQQASALEQFSQAVAKGKPDMIEWRAMLAAMPGQMMQIAQSFGLTTDELGAALRTGGISMDEFLDHIIQLNEEGIGEFASFETQARGATATIGTALTNVGNRVAAGWAEIFKVFGQENIAHFIDGMATNILNGFKSIAGAMQYMKDLFAESGIGEAFELIGAQIDVALDKIGKGLHPEELFGNIVDAITTIATGIADSGIVLTIGDIVRQVIDWFSGLYDTIKTIPFEDIFSTIIDAISGIVDWVSENGDTIQVILAGIAAGAAVLVGIQLGTWVMGLVTAFEAFMAVLAANPLVVAITLIAALVGMIVNFITSTEEGQAIWAEFTGFLSDAWDRISTAFSTFMDEFVSGWIDGVTNIRDFVVTHFTEFINSIVTFFTNLGATARQFFSELIAAVVGLVTIIVNFFVDLAASIINTVVTIVTSVIKFFSDLPGALRNIWMNIKAAAANAWNNIKTTVATVVSSIVSTITTKFQNVKSTISTTFSNIKSAITTPLNAAKDAVKNIIDKIKGFFNFSVSWPHIPVPSFGITPSGWTVGDLLKGVIPHLSISWHAKGGIVDGATLYGIGEAGPEAIVPLSGSKMRPFALAIADEMGGGNVTNYYIDGNMVSVDAKVAAALDTVAEYANTRARMGAAVRR